MQKKTKDTKLQKGDFLPDYIPMISSNCSDAEGMTSSPFLVGVGSVWSVANVAELLHSHLKRTSYFSLLKMCSS